MLTIDVIWTSIQRFLNVMDVRWMSKKRCVLTGKKEGTKKPVLKYSVKNLE